MKLCFNSMVRPKRGAKALVAIVPHLQLAKAQEAIAYLCGYDSWIALKEACEDPGAVPCLDDADLSSEQLASRQSDLIKRVKDVFGGSRAQALRILDAASLTKPSSGRPAFESSNPIVGTNIYMPPYGLIFGPDYPFLFLLLHDVRSLEIDFIQPGDEPLLTQLASHMRVTFKTGKSIGIEGEFLWKFLDLIPPAFRDSEGELRTDNPFTGKESVEGLLARLRRAYELLWKRAKDGEYLEILEPPLSISINFENGYVSTSAAPGLQATTRTALVEYLKPRIAELVEAVQPTLDAFMRTYLSIGYMELSYRKVNSTSVSPEYTPASWEGKEGLSFDEFLSMFSVTPFSESGCGGNLRYREKLARDLDPSISPDVILATGIAQLKKEKPDLFAVICEELGFNKRTAGKTVVEGLLSTKEAIELRSAILRKVFKAQKGKALSTWGVELSSRKPRPVVRSSRYDVPKSEGKQNV